MGKAFPLIGRWLVWKVGKGNKVKTVEDPWLGYPESFILSDPLINYLHSRFLAWLMLLTKDQAQHRIKDGNLKFNLVEV